MIVECSNCQTRFQLDDARIPARGIRVRCSRCKEAFFLEHPSASKAEVVDDVARRAASGTAAPDATRDLPVARSGARAEPDEEEWEFNDAPRVDPKAQRGSDARKRRAAAPAPAPARARKAVDEDDAFGSDEAADAGGDDGSIPGLGIDDMANGGSFDAERGLDLGSDTPERSGLDLSGLPDVRVDVEGGSDFGEASDFSALADEELEAEPPTPKPTAKKPSPKAPSKPAAQAPSKPAAKAPAKAAASGASGETEDWDFFSDEASESPASMDQALGRAMDAVHEEGRPRAAASRGPALGSVATSSPSRFAALRLVGNSVGWLVTLSLIGVGVARGVGHFGRAPEATATASVQIGDLRAEHVRGSWFETVRSTRLYAVTGKLTNEGARPVAVGSGLQAVLIGADGRPLELPAVRAGIDLSESDLRELSADELATAREHAAAMLAIAPLDPGRWVSFQVIFDGMPVQATGFVLEMAEGSAPVPLFAAEAREPTPEQAGAPAALAALAQPGAQPISQPGEQPVAPDAVAPAPASALPPELRASYGAPLPTSPTIPGDPQPSRP